MEASKNLNILHTGKSRGTEDSHLSHQILIFWRISTAENVILEKQKEEACVQAW
ncbi:hypothetical protein P5673_012969 [Acropora cervicornis]|uniref:Uncharacterized protein n=1 Tax=Acropora cervicornis TaxID=6130 RepID=A0AAD9QMF5_ACRCE|nr:hypothetical protein P5673_012969 [Acropora cervicornis]